MERKKAKKTVKKETPVKKSRVTGAISRSIAKKSTEEQKQIEFSFYAPLSTVVGVGGTFNQWDYTTFLLKKGKDGTWKGSFAIQPGRYEYRFYVDGNWENAQTQCEVVPNEFGSHNCVLVV